MLSFNKYDRELVIKVRFWGAWMLKSLEHSPSTDVAQVRFQLGAICGLSLLLIFSPSSEGLPVFPSPHVQKETFG